MRTRGDWEINWAAWIRCKINAVVVWIYIGANQERVNQSFLICFVLDITAGIMPQNGSDLILCKDIVCGAPGRFQLLFQLPLLLLKLLEPVPGSRRKDSLFDRSHDVPQRALSVL